MILPLILILLIAGAILAPVSAVINKKLPLYVAVSSMLASLLLLLSAWNYSSFPVLFKSTEGWMFEYNAQWIKLIGANIHLAMDGLSYIMVLLTLIMGIVAALASNDVERKGFYFFNTLLMIAGIVGIFIAIDMFLFFFFWEMMLCPLYFLIAAYSKEETNKAAFKFLVYTQASGLIMLLSILAMYFIYGHQSGIYSFDYYDLVQAKMSSWVSMLIMSGFVIAFFVKLPVIPFQGWLPITFKAAPVTAILTGLLIKTGAYGIIRFSIPMFMDASHIFAPAALVLGVVTILYAAFIAFSQTDLRLIAAYSGISHMGFILIGLYSFNELAWQGVVVQMVASAVSTSALVLIADSLLRRTGTCDINRMGGFWEKAPVLSGIGLFFAMASLGLPGLANFIAEFLILVGTFKVSILVAVLASLGVIAAAAYSLRIIQKVFVGNRVTEYELPEFNWKEKGTFGILIILLLWFGLYPKTLIERAKPAIEKGLTMPSPEDEIPQNTNNNSASVKL